MKITKSQIKALAELKRIGGAVMTSEWTTGSGRYTSLRSIPPFCHRIERWGAWRQPERINKVFRKHPRCQAVIAITDMLGANKILRE